MQTRKRNLKAKSKFEKLSDSSPKTEYIDSKPLLPVSPNVQRILLFVALCAFWSCVVIGVHRFVYPLEDGPSVFARADGNVTEKFVRVSCSHDHDAEKYIGCSPTICGRFVSDSVITELEARNLKEIAKKGLFHGGSNGGASILDLHSGALSKGDAFVDVYQVMQQKGISIISDEDFRLYVGVKNKVRSAIAKTFNVDEKRLHLTKPTFFSRITTKPASTVHDEYWHAHVDKETYGSFHFTALVYLSTKGDEFDGGDFIFLDADVNKTVEPRAARMSAFTSGAENPHRVGKVTRGVRYAVTIAFTCDPSQAISDPFRR